MTANRGAAWRYVTPAVVGAASVVAVAAFFYHQTELLTAARAIAAGLGHAFLFAAWAWAAYGVGRIVTRRVFAVTNRWWEVEWLAGFFFFGVLAFTLAASGVLYVWVMRGITLAAFALAVPTAARLARGAVDYTKGVWPTSTPGVVALAAAALPFAASLALGWGQPPFAWDALVYHLYLPKVFVAGHGFVYLPRLAYASMPLGGEMIFTWGYGWDGFYAAATAAPFVNALMVVVTWRLSRHYLDNFWAAAAAALLLFTPTFAELSDVPYVDFIVGAYALAAFALYIRGFRHVGEAAFAGVLLGAAMGVKYTGLYALVAFLPVLILDLARRRIGWRYVAVFLGAAFVAVLPWLVKAYIERGNPFFPVFYDVFGGRDLVPNAAAGVVRAMRDVGMGRSAADYLLLPWRISFQAGAGYDRFIGMAWPFSIPAVVLAFIWFRRWRLLIFTICYFAAWAVIGSQQLRFLSAGYGALAVTMAGVAGGAADAFRGAARRTARFAFIAFFVCFGYIMNIGNLINCWERFGDRLTGGREYFLSRWATCYDADKYINNNLTRDAVILMVFDYRTLYLEWPVVYDSFCEAADFMLAVSKMQNAGDVERYVRALGATHVLSDRAGAAYPWRYYDRRTRERWESYLTAYTTVIYADAYAELRAINDAGRLRNDDD